MTTKRHTDDDTPTRDLFAGDENAAPGHDPLGKPRQERFVQLMCYGEDERGRALSATESYRRSYGVDDPNVACAAASRLLTNPNVRARVAHLRSGMAERLGIDRAAILIQRWSIANRPASSPAAINNKLAALRDIERSLGFAPSDNSAGQTNIFNAPVHNGDNSTFCGLFKITDPAAFARAAEALRAARDNQTR